MKLVLVFAILVASQLSSAQVLLHESIDPREVTLPDGMKLWSEVQIEKIKDRPLRADIITSSTLFLENKILELQFSGELENWGKAGFNDQERDILVDTIRKKSLRSDAQRKWLCRLELSNCSLQKFSVAQLPALLQKYEWLFVDGKVYPRIAWNEVQIPSGSLKFIFFSSRFETYSYAGPWEDLKLKTVMLHSWVMGNCEQYEVSNEVQSIETTVMLSRQCFKTSLVAQKPTESFYQKNRKAIWIAAGLIVGAGAVSQFAGQNIILEKPSFK